VAMSAVGFPDTPSAVRCGDGSLPQAAASIETLRPMNRSLRMYGPLKCSAIGMPGLAGKKKENIFSHLV
jgi:hypothetical protein